MKNKTMRVAALLLALTLMTSCVVGGTFAKYGTGDEALDEAIDAGVVRHHTILVSKPGVDVDGIGKSSTEELGLGTLEIGTTQVTEAHLCRVGYHLVDGREVVLG